MNIDYDKVADAVFLTVSKGEVAKTIKMSDRLLVDLDAEGNTLGFEILEASAQEGLVKTLENNVKNGVPVNITDTTPISA